jgi:hypothetical protein
MCHDMSQTKIYLKVGDARGQRRKFQTVNDTDLALRSREAASKGAPERAKVFGRRFIARLDHPSRRRIFERLLRMRPADGIVQA